MRKVRGGHSKIRAHFNDRQPYHYNSRIALTSKIDTVSQAVWDRTLSPWARARLHSPRLSTDDEENAL